MRNRMARKVITIKTQIYILIVAQGFPPNREFANLRVVQLEWFLCVNALYSQQTLNHSFSGGAFLKQMDDSLCHSKST